MYISINIIMKLLIAFTLYPFGHRFHKTLQILPNSYRTSKRRNRFSFLRFLIIHAFYKVLKLFPSLNLSGKLF